MELSILPKMQPPDPPLAELVGIQFGMLAAKEIINFSVLEKGKSVRTPKELWDPRLGQPVEDRCATCGGRNTDECTGHFAHVDLSQPIFHPNHMRLLQHVLQKICLGCGVPLVKKKKTQDSSDPGIPGHISKTKGLENVKVETPQLKGFNRNDVAVGNGVIVLSSDDEDCFLPQDILKVVQPLKKVSFVEEVSNSESLQSPRRSLRKRKGKNAAKSSIENGPLTPKIAGGIQTDLEKYLSSEVTCASTPPSHRKKCPYCSIDSPEYPPVKVKIMPVRGKKRDELSQVLSMEIGAKTDNVASDYWGFVELTSKSYDLDFAPPRQRDLLPFEALRILKKIPEDSIGCLGMHKSVARPEALVMERVPVPPICTRTPDMKYVSNTTSVRFGTDRATRSLQTLVNEVARIRSTRSGKPTWRAGRDEFKLLQSITANYFRERGAPKFMAGKAIVKKDRNGRVMTQGDDYRWTKDWFTQNILGKSGNCTARAVITGDPAIAVDEIAIPDAISRELTVPERVTKWNQKRLQDCVDPTQMLDVKRGIGATSLIRNGEFIGLHATTTKQLEIGDVVNRHLQDGDYVYVNRPPSVHKHSLMALRVVLHPGMVIAINPFICPPFGADFDGDIFHIFVPQSVEAMVELKELMTVQQQIICSQGGLPLLGLTQDTLLAAHLMTCQKVFLDKVSMDQLQMWSSAAVVPEAAILKSPKGGPLWTGEQLYSLTLPAGVDFHTLDGEVLIRNGEILKTGFSSKWLQKGRNSLIDAICDQSGPEVVVEYLNSAKGLLHAWLDSNGFSTGLTDFLVTSNAEERRSMLQRVSVDCLQRAKEQSINTLQICDAKFQLSHLSVDLEVDGAFDRLEVNPASLSNKVQMLESIAIKAFRASMAGMGNIVQESSVSQNSLFSMVKAGSTKASMSKLLDQIACMGLQLYKGEHMLPFSRVLNNSAPLESQLQEWWEDHGLVQNSLVDGLTAFQLFNHVIANRTSILRKHVEVVQPGTLFKVLMLFLRDLHVGYDGTVRSQCGQKVVQFCYGGARARHRRSRKEDPDLRWKVSYLAGEPVGVLAATALSQPAYESMLDAPHHSGWKIRPLELVQETLYPREKGDPKAVDRRAILRLTHCDCSKSSCLERRVLRVQNQLRRIILKTLVQTSIIEYWDATNERKAGVNGAALRLGSPWLGHIHISKEVLQQHELTMTKIVGKLQRKFSILRPITKKNPLGQIFFCHSEFCDVSRGLCIHFSPKLPKKMQNQYDDDEYSHSLLELMKKMRDRILPALLECTIKGDERLESVKIVQEDCTWPSWHPKTAGVVRPGEEELVLEVVATSSVQQKSKRNMAWNAVMEACVPVMEEVDWQRSMPYSIQEMKHALGIEVAYQMVVQRVALALEETAPHTYREHIKLIGDMMTYSGDANGFTFSGFRDMIKSAHISAPFTEAAYQKPIRNFLDAAAKGAMDSLESVMTSCVWGREAPLGTGTKIELRWQPLHEDLQEVEEKDLHAILKELGERCVPDYAPPVSPAQSLPDYMENEEEQGIDEQAGFSPQQSPIQGDDENDPWGAVVNNNMEDNSDGAGGGGWGASKADKEGRGGWGAVESGKGSGGGGSDWDTVGDDDKSCKGGGGWERTGDLRVSARKKGVDKAEGDWGAINNECKDGGGNWGPSDVTVSGVEVAVDEDGGGWGAVTHSEQVSEEGGWDNVGDSKEKIPRDGHKSAGSDGKDNVGDWLRSSIKGNRKGDDQEERSWGAVHNRKGGGDTWGSMESVQEEQGWEGELAARKEEASCSGWGGTVDSGSGWEGFGDAPSHAKTTHINKNEKQSRDLGLLESCTNSDATGWGELSTQKDENGWGTTVATTKGSGDEDPWSTVASTGNEGDGWDAIAAGPGKSVSGEQDTNDGWGARDTPPKKLMASSGGYGQESEEASQVPWGGKEERGGGSYRGGRGRGRGRGRGGFGRKGEERGGRIGSGANSEPLGKRRTFKTTESAQDHPSGLGQGGSQQSQPWEIRKSNLISNTTGGSDNQAWGNLVQETVGQGADGAEPNPAAAGGSNWAQTWDNTGSEVDNATGAADPWTSVGISTQKTGVAQNATQTSAVGVGDGSGAWGAAESQVVNEDGWASIGTLTEATNDDGAEGGWASVGTPTQTKNSSAGDGWGSMDPISQNSAVGPFGPSNGGPTPRPPRREPECKDIDTLVRSLRSILQNMMYENGARISAQHNAVVQEVVVHHPKYTEKAGCGIAYIKVDKHPNFPDSRCFWIVREDGTETDFSYHKCLKEKAAKEFPDFVEKYDTTYTGKSRGPAAAPPPPPPANS